MTFSETNVVTAFKINSYFEKKNTYIMIMTSVSNGIIIFQVLVICSRHSARGKFKVENT